MKKKIKIVVIALLIIASFITIKDEVQYRLGAGAYNEENTFALNGCNVAGITFWGELFTYYDEDTQSADDVASAVEIVYLLEVAEDTPNIKAILLSIDSYGGSPFGAQEIVNTIKNYVSIPVIAEIREFGLSAGYWVASSADYIFATELSDVGAIGVTMSYLDNSGFNNKEGYIYNSLSTGKFKDMYDPNKPLTWEEKQLAKRDLDIMHDIFVKDVALNREMDIEKVKGLADGSSMLGEMALEAGLIDEIGGYYEAQKYLTNLIGEEAVVCW